VFGFVAVGNAVGGLGFVTVLRLVQVGSSTVNSERQRPQDRRPPQAA
jgi:hypothetical protein